MKKTMMILALSLAACGEVATEKAADLDGGLHSGPVLMLLPGEIVHSGPYDPPPPPPTGH